MNSNRRIQSSLLQLLILAATLTTAVNSYAVPLFARQTQLKCGMCHAPPPSLTKFGRRFKQNGYTFTSDKKGPIPISLVALSTYSNTKKDLSSPPGPDAELNNNITLQQLSLSTGGRITDNIGAYVQLTYEGLRDKVSLGTVEIRTFKNTYVKDRNVLFSAAINNSPSYQDPWVSNGVRAWPYFYFLHEPRSTHNPVLDGELARRVMGVSGTAFIDDSLHLEVAAYSGMSEGLQRDLGLYEPYYMNLENTGVYARVAKELSMGLTNMTVGATFFNGDIKKAAGRPADGITELALDVLYQSNKGPHDINLSGNLLYESLDTSNSQGLGFASGDSASLTRFTTAAQYLYKKTWGLGVGYSQLSGTADALYYRTANGKPDTATLRLDAFWNPISKKPFKIYPLGRTRIGLEYVRYRKFNGRANNYDGLGRDASDNGTFSIYWIVVM
jgi:hypothetical protein